MCVVTQQEGDEGAKAVTGEERRYLRSQQLQRLERTSQLMETSWAILLQNTRCNPQSD